MIQSPYPFTGFLIKLSQLTSRGGEGHGRRVRQVGLSLDGGRVVEAAVLAAVVVVARLLQHHARQPGLEVRRARPEMRWNYVSDQIKVQNNSCQW